MSLMIMLLAFVAAPAPEDTRLAGRWKDGERHTVSELTRGADGCWSGVIVASPRKDEVGRTSFFGLRWDGRIRRFIGTLRRPDSDEVVDVQVWLTSPATMSAEARISVFSKILSFTRVKP